MVRRTCFWCCGRLTYPDPLERAKSDEPDGQQQQHLQPAESGAVVDLNETQKAYVMFPAAAMVVAMTPVTLIGVEIAVSLLRLLVVIVIAVGVVVAVEAGPGEEPSGLRH